MKFRVEFFGEYHLQIRLLTLSLPLQSILEVVHGLVSRVELSLEGSPYVAHP